MHIDPHKPVRPLSGPHRFSLCRRPSCRHTCLCSGFPSFWTQAIFLIRQKTCAFFVGTYNCKPYHQLTRANTVFGGGNSAWLRFPHCRAWRKPRTMTMPAGILAAGKRVCTCQLMVLLEIIRSVEKFEEKMFRFSFLSHLVHMHGQENPPFGSGRDLYGKH